ncbi:WecB/TagA/CpsF family glycosyltransferase [Aestuariivita sp.]|jgi:exopolysaccharide biosynthesis WecB/TagA/CpsF family protein|uniref:WecB/TagA/CpsF family glycosyltransferase n=1 Tax=Aestuariivita sp. TaxID=1872407 RepID=UPI0021704D49|nr:WecB/TagA/CpsF family glycosyltransferase [Aestuariivita sp.]MCE8009692.1 WecB/TagA/CpsF family glycosyltransferase [Aestuariivita sp.]
MQFSFGTDVIGVNVPDWPSLRAEVTRRFRAGEGFALATINLDHLVKMAGDAGFASIYAQQDLIVADGRPIVWLSRLAGRPVGLVPGSDSVMPLAQLAAQEGVAVALVGSTEAALADAAEALCRAAPGLRIVMQRSPAFGFDAQSQEATAILSDLTTRDVGLCFLALGAPRQEALAARGRVLAPSVGFASIGAGLDFLGGHQRRAPQAMRRLGLEWLWRALTDPLRLGPRYARCIAILPGQVWAAWRLRR